MVLLAQAGTFTSQAATGNQTVSLDSGIWGGESPKVVFIWGTRQNADGIAVSAVTSFGVGLSSASRAAVATCSNNGKVTSEAQGRHSNAAVITTINGTGITLSEADFVSFGANQFMVNWTIQPDQKDYHYLVLGGPELQVYLDQIQSPTSAQSVSYTGVGFRPDALLAFWAQHAIAPPDTRTHGAMGFGFSDGTTDRGIAIMSENNAGTSDTYRYQAAKLLTQLNTAGASLESALVDSLDTDGYTLTWDVADVNERYAWILCLKGLSVNVQAALQPAADSAVSRTIRFPPRAALFTSAMNTTSASIEDHALLGIGAWDYSNNMVCTGVTDRDNIGTTNAHRSQDSNEAFKQLKLAAVPTDPPTVNGSMSAAASGKNLVETWTNCDTVQREHILVTFGSMASLGGATSRRPRIGLGLGL